MICHALNRGNRCETVFHKSADFDAFVATMNDARGRVSVDLFGYCLMPNHFHLVRTPHGDADLGSWMQWCLTGNCSITPRSARGPAALVAGVD